MAIVNSTELVTYSDVLWQLALEPDTPLDNPRPADIQRALERVVDQRLIMQEASKLPTITVTDAEVDDELKDLIRRFPSSEEFYARARRAGLNGEQVREIVRQRVQIINYLNFRFRSFTVVTDKEIADYYRDVWSPRFRRQQPGVIVPPLADVRARVERELTNAKIESDINSFLEDARARADIVTFDQ